MAKLECDFKADASYIPLKEIHKGEVAFSREAENAEVVLDFDKDNKLIGIELLYLGLKEGELREGQYELSSM